jgi:hypothetical protein
MSFIANTLEFLLSYTRINVKRYRKIKKLKVRNIFHRDVISSITFKKLYFYRNKQFDFVLILF